MCGICGIVHFSNRAVDETDLRVIMTTMKHRGPDDGGVFIERNVGLGFVRLSILDLSPSGHQPMISRDGRHVLIFNGEVFNYIELRNELQYKGHTFTTRTDTEVVLAAYREWGEDCLPRFNGMWALAIYDRQNKSLFVSRDRYGIKPFYYYSDNNCFVFASELSALLKACPQKPGANNQAIFDYLIFNRTDHNELTFFEGIKKLQHGCNLVIIKSIIGKPNINIIPWYRLRPEVLNTEPFRSAEEFRQLFTDAVELRLRSDVAVGVCLSGGLDSSSIVSILLKENKKRDLTTFSAVYGHGQYGDEREFISEFSSKIDTMYYTSPDAQTLCADLNDFIRAHGEPIPSTGVYAQYKVMELARKHVVVTLDGQGADEMLAGYHYFFGFFFKDLLHRKRLPLLVSEIAHYIHNHRSLYGLQTFAYFLLPKSVRTKARLDEKGYLRHEFAKAYSDGNTIAGNLYGANSLHDALLDHFEYKLEHLLKWEDRNSMWFSLEARVPFLDHRLVEKTLALPEDQIIHHGMTKYILRQAMQGVLPEKIRLRRDKIGFDTPQDEWFRSPQFQKIVKEVLTSESLVERRLIDNHKALQLYQRHLDGQINIAKEIWKWLHLELWFREFID